MAEDDPLHQEYMALIRRNGLEEYVKRRAAVIIDEKAADAVFNNVELNLIRQGVERQQVKRVMEDIKKGIDLNKDEGYNPIIQNLNKRLVNLLNPVYPVNIPVYAGSYPHGSFNAQTCMTPAGVLILLNEGIIRLLTEVTGIFSHFIVFTSPETDASSPGPSPRQYSVDESLDALADTILSYISQNAYMGKRLPLDYGGRNLIARRMAEYASIFALAHEYGHLISNHLGSPRNALSYSDKADPRPRWIQKSQGEEFEADGFATVAMLFLVPYELFGPEEKELSQEDKEEVHFRTILCGSAIYFFFSIELFLEKIRLRLANRVRERVGRPLLPPADPSTSTHPPSEERMRNIEAIYANISGDKSLIEAIDKWFKWIEEPTVDRVWNLMAREIRNRRINNDEPMSSD